MMFVFTSNMCHSFMIVVCVTIERGGSFQAVLESLVCVRGEGLCSDCVYKVLGLIASIA